ncbi:hypothetical protein ACWGLE_18645 [Streptomyces sp. NPDC055897]
MPIPNPIPLMVLHMEKDVIAPTRDDLEWTLFDPRTPAARRTLPSSPGVYCWCDRLHGGIHYIGQAAGGRGLWARAGEEIRLVRSGNRLVEDGADATLMANHWDGFSRYMATINAVMWWAATATAAETNVWEGHLLQQAIRLTGVVPPVNGGAWLRSLGAREWAQQADGEVQFGPGITDVPSSAEAST